MVDSLLSIGGGGVVPFESTVMVPFHYSPPRGSRNLQWRLRVDRKPVSGEDNSSGFQNRKMLAL